MVWYTVLRLTGIATGDVKIPTPRPSHRRTGFDLGPGPAGSHSAPSVIEIHWNCNGGVSHPDRRTARTPLITPEAGRRPKSPTGRNMAASNNPSSQTMVTTR